MSTEELNDCSDCGFFEWCTMDGRCGPCRELQLLRLALVEYRYAPTERRALQHSLASLRAFLAILAMHSEEPSSTAGRGNSRYRFRTSEPSGPAPPPKRPRGPS